MSKRAAIAVVRFGIGARPGEIGRAARDPQDWLDKQITPAAALRPNGDLYTTMDAITRITSVARLKRNKTPEAQAKIKVFKTIGRSKMRGMEITARLAHASATPTPFAERWADFWVNHFTVSIKRKGLLLLVGPFEREAIRPNVFGKFKDLLEASTLHPAMLIYLDNSRSVGPSTRFAKKRKKGLNENLAREVLELHTLGVDGGYTQNDVESFAKALTGWAASTYIPGVVAETPSVFLERHHEPFAQTVLNRRFANSGPDQARDILAFLAEQPATAKNIGFKLARHFIADDPPPAAVAALAASFTQSNGDLSAVARTLITLEEAWQPELRKFKSPWELIVSSTRMFGEEHLGKKLISVLNSFSHTPFSALSPEGWGDVEGAWLSPDGVTKRLEWANFMARRTGEDGRRFIQEAVGDLVDQKTVLAINNAEDRSQALVLALMSPCFQRR